LANFLLARSVSRADYGSFALLYSVYVFLSGLHNAVVLEAMLVFGSGRYRDQFPTFFRYISRAHLIFAFAIGILFASAAFLLSALGSPYFRIEEYGLALATFFLLSGNWVRYCAYAQSRPELAIRFTLQFSIVACAGMALLFRAQALTPNRVFLVLAAGWLATLPLVPQLTDWKTSKTFDVDRHEYWRGHWKYSRWTLATAFVFQLMNQGYYWCLAAVRSLASVGNLKAAHNLVRPTDLLLAATAMLALSGLSNAIAQGDLSQFRSRVRRLLVVGLSVSVAAAVPLMLFGDQLLHLVYGGRYDGLASVLRVLAVVPCLTALGNALNDALKVALRPDAVFYSYLAAGAVALAIGPWMISRYGELGAAWGLVISAATYTASMAMFYRGVVRAGRLTPTTPADVLS